MRWPSLSVLLTTLGAALSACDAPAPTIDATAPPTTRAADTERGAELAAHRQKGNCLACHAIPALAHEPFHGDIGPSLAGVALRYDEAELRRIVVDPKRLWPDTIMPAFHRTDGLHRVMVDFEGEPILLAQEVEDVVAFLLTLTEEEDAPAMTPWRVEASGLPAPEGSPLPELISGYHYNIAETQAIQDDDDLNPGMFWVEAGERLWDQVEGAAGRSCADCHGDAATSMREVGATYPVVDGGGRLLNIARRVNQCRSEEMGAEPWPFESRELVAMTTFVRHQARGLPVDVAIDGPARPHFERGREHYYQRRGQLDMACAQCHDRYHGRLLRGDRLSQGHSNSHPVYALGMERVRSLHWLLEHCNEYMRSEPYEPLSDEYVALELFLAWRGNGLPVEVPAVRW
jgi:L-cysteine S-thiosulfotransferase